MKLVIIHLLKLFLGVLLLFPLLVLADQAWPIITFTCDKDKNEVKLKNEVKWGDAGKNFPFNEKQGTYNPWDLVNIEDRGSRKLVSEKSRLTLNCQLKNADYTFIVWPKIFNPSYTGTCGDRLSVKVSVHRNQSIIIENKDMEKFCHGNAPVLRGIKVKDSSGKVKLYEVKRSQFY